MRQSNKQRVHYTAPYLLNPEHLITVDLIGLGGTGSMVLSMLGRINASLIALGHVGIHVRGWDPDTVSEANLGRQLFATSELGHYKANCLIGRINRFFGTDWEAHSSLFNAGALKGKIRSYSNITITCVDTIAARRSIGKLLHKAGAVKANTSYRYQPHSMPYYWLDFGNGQQTGQAVLGTLRKIEQPKKVPKEYTAIAELQDVLQKFPELGTQKDTDSGPSCSLAEALDKQDLFINPTLGNMGMDILWKLFRELRITDHGVFVNLRTLTTNPIKI